MRKKFDAPAPLTINFAFNEQFLDLVSGTTDTELQAKPKLQNKRYVSTGHRLRSQLETYTPQKSISRSHSFTSRPYNKRFAQTSMKSSVSRLPFMINSGTQILISESGEAKGLKPTTMSSHSRGIGDIDYETSKAMIKNIRKNILSNPISVDHMSTLESSYKQLLLQMKERSARKNH